jgi:MoaA/NifB/PqqE/SkfB family radical SAM enzyme
LVTLYVTERCNSRCVSCDHWRHGRRDLDLGFVERLWPSLEQLRTSVVVLSGGEPLVHPQWRDIAAFLKSMGVEVWLLTAGLALAKQARRATRVFDSITVSLDGADRGTYAAIRGLDAFDHVLAGIRAAASHGVAPDVRVTLQRANYRQLPALVDLARAAGARRISFLAVDVANSHAFGRGASFHSDLALRAEDLPVLDSILSSMEIAHAESFRSGFIAESPAKLRRILQYFAAVLGQAPYPAVRCNAPEFSAVIGADGRVQPCFFISGNERAGDGAGFAAELNSARMHELRTSIRAGRRSECTTCVCSLWREPGRVHAA